jgi:hypothetical protein
LIKFGLNFLKGLQMLKKIGSILLLSSLLLANNINKDDDVEEVVVGSNNLKLELGLWNAQLDGTIKNVTSSTDIKDDLGYNKTKAITTFGMEINTNYVWIPDIKVDYFFLNTSNNSVLDENKTIGNNAVFSGSVTTATKYSELNSKIYGYITNQIFKVDLGINLKKIDYTQSIKENSSNGDYVVIKGPDNMLFLPYIGITMDLGKLKLFASSSLLALGDDEANDYEYKLSLTTFDSVELNLGYKYHSWKSTNANKPSEKYDTQIYGSYFSIKVIF